MFKKVGTFLEETRQELKKVTWPSRNELLQATQMVILTTILMGCLIGVVDIVVAKIVQMILG